MFLRRKNKRIKKGKNLNRTELFFYTLIVSLLLVANVYAQESKAKQPEGQQYAKHHIDTNNMSYERTPLNKFGRGLVNILTCMLEVPAEAYSVSQEKDPFVGCTLGVAEGFITAFLRALSGAFDVATFFIPPYNKPLMKPEYAFGSAREKFRQHRGKFDEDFFK